MMWGAGLVLAGTVFTGLLLNLFTGLTSLSWAVALAVVVAAVVCADLVIMRRGAITGRGAAKVTAAPVPDPVADEVTAAHVSDAGADEVKPAPVRRSGFRFSPVTGGFLMLAAVLAGGAVWLANASAGWQHSSGFAQLWLTPATTTTSTLGVRDNFPGQQTFQLVLRDRGKAIGTWDLLLSNGQAWQQTVARPAGSTLTATLDLPNQTLKVTS
jgi:hypothetical protein